MYKIGVIGDRESVLGFKAVGLEVFPCDQADEAKKVLKRIAKEDYAIIYVTEKLFQYLGDEADSYINEIRCKNEFIQKLNLFKKSLEHKG